jgi:hypothetical protein
MIAQLKLKNVVDTEDAKETMEIYNVILLQLNKVVNVTTDPSDDTFECCLDILRESSFAMAFEDVIKSACTKNQRVQYYVGEKTKLRNTSKLRPIAERLRRHSHIITASEKPLAFRWDGGGGDGERQAGERQQKFTLEPKPELKKTSAKAVDFGHIDKELELAKNRWVEQQQGEE